MDSCWLKILLMRLSNVILKIYFSKKIILKHKKYILHSIYIFSNLKKKCYNMVKILKKYLYF